MSAPSRSGAIALDARARQSLGVSHEVIHRMVARALAERGVAGGRLVDVGCGNAGLWRLLAGCFQTCCGLDAVRYEGFPTDAEFRQIDLDAAQWPVAPGQADVVTAVETIEHLENPWAFVRALVRIAKPGGWVVVTTPNQLSLLSLGTLLVKHRFSAFQDVHYPAHRTALLESDLRRLFEACRLEAIAVAYSLRGRVPLTPWHHPDVCAHLFPRTFSDNVMIIGQKPHE